MKCDICYSLYSLILSVPIIQIFLLFLNYFKLASIARQFAMQFGLILHFLRHTRLLYTHILYHWQLEPQAWSGEKRLKSNVSLLPLSVRVCIWHLCPSFLFVIFLTSCIHQFCHFASFFIMKFLNHTC